ncbi:hypothetical protein N7478_002280 [Penicillium angulare]|uniref:uncharacterized protein n=1 Tax=Penicillium angulare TaxID=116970 RepID=UPI002540073E|nr:uncharacterized protein N7478_002280 [Penicillium angulare]KAJ5286594.1 hypothetical protein N7478_002280 [Penicillium angulare]
MSSQHHDILDIEDALVTPSNPARNDYTLDYTRCSRLHNYIVGYLWSAQHNWETPSTSELAARPRTLGYEPDHDISALRSRLHPSVNKLIDLTYESENQFFYFVHGLDAQLADEWILELYDEYNLEERGLERFVIIYGTVADLGGHCMGMIYDQELHRATLTLSLWSFDNVFPISEHDNMWFPLETILSHWIDLIKMGKVIAHEDEGTPEEVRKTRSQIGPWSWFTYCEKQVDDTVAAIDRYTAAIESRMPEDSLLDLSRDAQFLTNADLDAALVPKECFIRSVLTRIKTPRFNMIAPGLAVSHDKQAFINRQQFTKSPPVSSFEGETVAPVLIFASADSSRTVPFNEELRHLFCRTRIWEKTTFNENDPIYAGLYSEPTERGAHDNEEAGFRLVLPFALRPDYRDNGARKSDGSHVSAGSFTELFQNGGYYAFGGEHRSQRLERLMNQWEEMVESGVWTVGVDGVEGGIDLFRDADRGAWRDYWIAPSW